MWIFVRDYLATLCKKIKKENFSVFASSLIFSLNTFFTLQKNTCAYTCSRTCAHMQVSTSSTNMIK